MIHDTLRQPFSGLGKPFIQGTRVPVSIVVGSLAAGMTIEEVQQEYELTREDIQAALAFAYDLVQKKPLS